MSLYLFFYFFIYLIFFQVKSIRDYITEYNRGLTHRWETSHWSKLPRWFQAYLLDNDQMFLDNDPPTVAKFLLWNEKTNKFRLSFLDGWHQLDGFIFVAPHTFIVLLILNYNIWISLLFSFILAFGWYEYFNYVYHIQHRTKGHKEYDRVWWAFWK